MSTPIRGSRFGAQVLGDVDAAAAREWLVTDGCGGYASGSVGGLRTRRYHGLLMVAVDPPRGRKLALVALDPVLVVGDRRIRLACDEWGGGTIDPAGNRFLVSFDDDDGVPRWRWHVGGIVFEREVAMRQGRSGVGVVHRLLAAPGPVRLELAATGTWRDQHGDRRAAGDPTVTHTADGFVFEGAWRAKGDGWTPGGEWYRDVHWREEAARGLNANEDVWMAGTFGAELAVGDAHEVVAWAGQADMLAQDPPTAGEIVAMSRQRARSLVAAAGAPAHSLGARLLVAADRFIAAGSDGPTVVAGYPWFGDWGRDTMTSYEGLFLASRRYAAGADLLSAAAASVSDGMLANTADVGERVYNTADAALWFLHAVGRHVEVTGDVDLGVRLVPTLVDIVRHTIAGTRYGIIVDPTDGLVTQGADGIALTWMDARVDGVPVTPRRGKAVELSALWLRGLAVVARLLEEADQDATTLLQWRAHGLANFASAFARPDGRGLRDIADGPDGPVAGGDKIRPNQLFAVSLPDAPLADAAELAASVVAVARTELWTPLGLRSLAPDDPDFRGRHRGGPAERDGAYHQGTVWPWLLGAYADAVRRTGEDPTGILDAGASHLNQFGVGGVSETADGDAPHFGTGCPWQAWSVAEWLRTLAPM